MQVRGERLRVNVQLIDAATDEHLWAERYDRTLDDAFAIQSDIAQQIVAAVGATLGGTERTAIAAVPTANPEAYRLYLQGREYYRRPGYLRRNLEIAQGFYERALVLDSTFALAYAALSEIHGRMSWFRYDPSPERLVRQREAAEAALRLAPDLPQAHLAMGLVHYFGRRDWQAALQEYLGSRSRDCRMTPSCGRGSGTSIAGSGTGTRRSQRSTRSWRSTRATPMSSGTWVANTLRLLHRYQEAVEWYSRALALAPDLAPVRRVAGGPGSCGKGGWTRSRRRSIAIRRTPIR